MFHVFLVLRVVKYVIQFLVEPWILILNRRFLGWLHTIRILMVGQKLESNFSNIPSLHTDCRLQWKLFLIVKNMGIGRRSNSVRCFQGQTVDSISPAFCFPLTEPIKFSPRCSVNPIHFQYQGACNFQAGLLRCTITTLQPTVAQTSWQRGSRRSWTRLLRVEAIADATIACRGKAGEHKDVDPRFHGERVQACPTRVPVLGQYDGLPVSRRL